MIYLDNNATTRLNADIKEQMFNLLLEPLNPSAVNIAGQKAKATVEDCRMKILNLLNLKDYDIIFTPSATISNNIVLKSFKNKTIFYSNADHESIKNHCINNDGIEYNYKYFSEFDFKQSKTDDFLCCYCLVSGETGILTDGLKLASCVKKIGGFVHADLSQALCKVDVDFSTLNFDFATISGHKIGGPVGSSALIYKKDLFKLLKPIINGGGQEFGIISGTINVCAIYGLMLAIESGIKNLKHNICKFDELNQQIYNFFEEKQLHKNILFSNEERSKNTIVIQMPNVAGSIQMMKFDAKKIAISLGSACSSGKINYFKALENFKIESEIAKNCIRISTWVDTSMAEVDDFCDAWFSFYKEANKNT